MHLFGTVVSNFYFIPFQNEAALTYRKDEHRLQTQIFKCTREKLRLILYPSVICNE